MTREIRSRRAGLSRDESRQQPLYSRLLGLQYVTPNGFLCFVFFEGAVALGILLALAELVSWWGVLLLPFTVALMVKLNDIVAGAVIQTPSAGSRASRASASRASATRVTASQTSAPSDDPPFFVDWTQADTRTMPAAVPAVRRAAVRPAAAPAGGYVSGRYASGGIPTGGLPGGTEAVTSDVRGSTPASLRAAEVTPAPVRAEHMSTVVARRASASGGHPAPDVPELSALNGPPMAGHWDARTEQLGSPVRWARQAARRRYE